MTAVTAVVILLLLQSLQSGVCRLQLQLLQSLVFFKQQLYLRRPAVLLFVLFCVDEYKTYTMHIVWCLWLFYGNSAVCGTALVPPSRCSIGIGKVPKEGLNDSLLVGWFVSILGFLYITEGYENKISINNMW